MFFIKLTTLSDINASKIHTLQARASCIGSREASREELSRKLIAAFTCINGGIGEGFHSFLSFMQVESFSRRGTSFSHRDSSLARLRSALRASRSLGCDVAHLTRERYD